MEKDIPIAQFHFLAPSSEAVSATVNSLDAELGSPRGVSMVCWLFPSCLCLGWLVISDHLASQDLAY